ncbi:MAG: hypothetical protein V2A58_16590 [Planctomycetota bacterium]
MASLLLGFALAALVVVVAGTFLARFADSLAVSLKLSRAWVGLLFLAVVTSLPELATSLSAVTVIRGPDLALGTLFGSNLFNLLMLAALRVVPRARRCTIQTPSDLTLSAAGSILLISIATFGVATGGAVSVAPRTFEALLALSLVVAYLVLLRATFRAGSDLSRAEEDAPASLWKPSLGFALCALAVIAGGLWLVRLGDALAGVQVSLAGRSFTLGRTAVGTFLIAVVTSLPELVVTVAALRLGSLDMAFGNLFGSNMCNMAFVGVVALASPGRSLFASSSPIHALTGLLSVALTAVAIAALSRRESRPVPSFPWDAVVMLLLYLLGLVAMGMVGLAAPSG